MATHGKAREITIAALRECKPFARKGFGMTAVLSDLGCTSLAFCRNARVVRSR